MLLFGPCSLIYSYWELFVSLCMPEDKSFGFTSPCVLRKHIAQKGASPLCTHTVLQIIHTYACTPQEGLMLVTIELL